MSYNMPEFKGKKRFVSKIYQKDDDNDIFSKNIVYYFVELSKFAAQLETLDMSDERNRILYMFTNVVYLQKNEINTLTPMQMRFYEECQINNFTDMEKQDYVKSLMEYPSVQEMIECERAEGIQIGIEQGREEEKRQIVRNMLAKGFDPDLVAEIVGLTAEEVREVSATA